MESIYILLVVLGGLLGATTTSYYGVLIQRGFRDSILGRSKCDHCGRKLGVLELIPIASSLFWALKPGGSRCCQQRIPLTYFWTEAYGAIFGGIAALALVRVISTLQLEAVGVIFMVLTMSALLLILLFSAVEDIWLLSIDIRLPLAAIAIFAVLIFVLGAKLSGGQQLAIELFEPLLSAWVGAIAVVSLIIFSRGKGLGGGDIYWFFFVGLSLGLTGLAITALLNIFSAAAVGIVFSIYKKRMRGEIIPLVPFIILSWLLAFTFQAELLATWQKLLYV